MPLLQYERERVRDDDEDEDDTLLHKDKDLSKSRLFYKSVHDDKHSNIQYSTERKRQKLRKTERAREREDNDDDDHENDSILHKDKDFISSTLFFLSFFLFFSKINDTVLVE